jgi:hypothetical protein
MKHLVKAITGVGFLLSSSILLTFVLDGLDPSRVDYFGLFHELANKNGIGIFLISAIFMLIGILLCAIALLSNKE